MILMYVLIELGYVLICQVKDKETNVVLKMLLWKRVKNQREIKNGLIVIIFDLNVHLHGFVSLHHQKLF